MSSEIKKYLGIDWGAVRIGLATGDSGSRMSLPFKVVGSIGEIVDIINKEDIDEIIIGEPIRMTGDKNGRTDEYNKFIVDLKSKVKMPVILVDERLTSKAAEALSGNKKTKAPQDAIAAMLILQSYFDSMA